MQGWAMRLTLLRMVLIPLFVLVFYVHPESWLKWPALIVYTIACISDYFDGYFARTLGEESALGAFLDPVADKLMVTVVIIVVLQSRPEWWLMAAALVIIGREIWISALREWMAGQNARGVVAVSSAGKWKTTVQMLALGFLIYQADFMGLPIWQIGKVLMIIAVVLTLWSMWQYNSAAWRYFSAQPKTGEANNP